MNDDLRTTNTTITTIKAIVLQLSAILYILLLISPIAMTLADKQQDSDSMRRGMLRRFGLENVPVQNGPSLEIPQHVWDIYDNDNEVDWVRHYYPKEIIEDNTGFMMSYNLSIAARNAKNEEVIKAILKLRLRRNSTTGENGNISIFFDDKNQIKRQIDSIPLSNLKNDTENDNEWIDFDVTSAFHKNLEDMINLYIELPNGVEIDETQSSSMSSLPYAKAQSAPLIVFSDHSEPIYRRRKRSAQTGPSERKNRKKGRKHQNYEVDTSLCRKTELYVDFDELGWQDWIMAPKGYEAGQCQGSCPNPMPAHLNASNHAIIQSLLHSINPNDVPPPCCVPTETSPLSILYMDIDNVIVIKEYADMRVESCGCR